MVLDLFIVMVYTTMFSLLQTIYRRTKAINRDILTGDVAEDSRLSTT